MSGADASGWGDWVATLREQARLSRTELARAAGVSRVTVHRWETGQQRPERAHLVTRVAEVLGADATQALAAAGMYPPAAASPRRGTSGPDLHPLARELDQLLRTLETSDRDHLALLVDALLTPYRPRRRGRRRTAPSRRVPA
ncbi:MAG TPA: helix-turn-helix transcriptional regulator [Natronosporangium sp.]|nr:helix-turn-helix transcriptional regulator [Natronosporangium sp.]